MEQDFTDLNHYFSLLDKILPRYIRGPKHSAKGLKKLASAVGEQDFFPVRWLDEFYCIPGIYSNVAKLNCIERGLYPMDIASALAVSALELNEVVVNANDCNVLDLCCCPGSKYLYILDLLDRSPMQSGHTLVGVDVSEHRLRTCKSLISKWTSATKYQAGISRTRHLLFNCDGTLINALEFGVLVADSNVTNLELAERGSRRQMNKSAKGREKKRLREIEAQIRRSPPESGLLSANFDFVLVDAECTHDGSYRHMRYVEEYPEHNAISETEDNTVHDHITPSRRNSLNLSCTEKFVNKSEVKSIAGSVSERGKRAGVFEDFTAEDIEPKVDDRFTTMLPDEANFTRNQAAPKPYKKQAHIKFRQHCESDVVGLQRGLLGNGFSLLRPGGTLVYSTCRCID